MMAETDVWVMQVGQNPHFRIEAFEYAGKTIFVDRYDLDGDLSFHEHMFGEKDNAHGPGSQPIEHAMVAENQSMRGPNQDPVELILCQ